MLVADAIALPGAPPPKTVVSTRKRRADDRNSTQLTIFTGLQTRDDLAIELHPLWLRPIREYTWHIVHFFQLE